MFYSIYAESTPNPEVMKFVSNRMLADKSLEFLNPSEAKKIPMIQKIFSLPFVESIFLSSNFISIKKTNNIEWGEIILELRNFITKILNEDDIQNYTENIEIEKEKKISEKKDIDPEKKNMIYSEIEQDIIGLLNEYIKPAVEGDGGAIEFDSFSLPFIVSTPNLSLPKLPSCVLILDTFSSGRPNSFSSYPAGTFSGSS